MTLTMHADERPAVERLERSDRLERLERLERLWSSGDRRSSVTGSSSFTKTSAAE